MFIAVHACIPHHRRLRTGGACKYTERKASHEALPSSRPDTGCDFDGGHGCRARGGRDLFTGDRRLACEAVLCLASGLPPQECQPSLRRYFSIQLRQARQHGARARQFPAVMPDVESVAPDGGPGRHHGRWCRCVRPCHSEHAPAGWHWWCRWTRDAIGHSQRPAGQLLGLHRQRLRGHGIARRALRRHARARRVLDRSFPMGCSPGCLACRGRGRGCPGAGHGRPLARHRRLSLPGPFTLAREDSKVLPHGVPAGSCTPNASNPWHGLFHPSAPPLPSLPCASRHPADLDAFARRRQS